MSAVLTGCGHFSSGGGKSPEADSVQVTYGYDSLADFQNRLAIDFNRDEAYIRDYLKPYYPNLTDGMMKGWEASGALETMVIDGHKRYFRNAGRNLFRIDKGAKAVYDSVNVSLPKVDGYEKFLDGYLHEVIAAVKSSGKTYVMPVKHTIRYELSVDADAVPAGETVRAWLPYPRTDIPDAQFDVKLVSASEHDYVISPDSYRHKTIYMEKKADSGKPTVFTCEYSYKANNRWFDFDADKIKPYDKGSAEYREFTAEQVPHIVFSPRIRHIADSLTAGIVNPYRKMVLIYGWIVDNFPWASAREYSTIDDIPEYVLDNRHGDCGQVGMLLITMCRCEGIPARWQSGWMLHPGEINLHDWSEAYFEGVGWIPVDVSFGRGRGDVRDNPEDYLFYTRGLDAYRLIVNDGWGGDLYPAKIYPRSETVDFQRGEVEWRGGNLYFDKWNYSLKDGYGK
jgi:transglutaminase-like putative cysteine protease